GGADVRVGAALARAVRGGEDLRERPRVYVTRRIPEEGLALVREATNSRVWEGELPPPREVLLEEVAEIEGLLCLLTDRIDEALLDAAPRLRVVSQMAVGVDNIDVAARPGRAARDAGHHRAGRDRRRGRQARPRLRHAADLPLAPPEAGTGGVPGPGVPPDGRVAARGGLHLPALRSDAGDPPPDRP